MAAFVLICNDCDTLSTTAKTRKALQPLWRDQHDGHNVQVVGGRWICMAWDLASLLPYGFRQRYWETRLPAAAAGRVIATAEGLEPADA